MLLEELKWRFPLGEVDMIIGLTSVNDSSKQPIRDPHTIGQAQTLSGYLVLRDPTNRLFRIQQQTALVHEIGHLFGAIHTEDPASIMYPVVNKQLPTKFDRENHEIIMETRRIDFKRGINALPKPVIQRLLGSYIKMVATDQPVDFFYMLGFLYLSLDQYENTASAWKKAAEILPRYPRIHYDLGMLYYQMGNQRASIRELMQAVQGFHFPSQNSEKVRALVALGSALQAVNDFSGAYNAFSRALALDPKNREVKMNLAIILMNGGQLDNASREFESLLYQDPKNAKLLANLGICYFKTKRLMESERYLNRALENAKRSSPESAEIRTYLAKVYYQLGKPQKALEHFQAACASYPNADCYKGLAQMHFELGQWNECIRDLATVLQVQKDDPDVYGTMGVALIQKGDYANALSILREGLRYSKDNKTSARLQQNIGHVMIQLKHYDMAEKEFQVCIGLDWSNVDCHQGMALAYIGLQRLVDAKKEFENVLRIDPQNQKAKEMMRTIDKMLSQAAQVDIQLQGR